MTNLDVSLVAKTVLGGDLRAIHYVVPIVIACQRQLT